MAEVTIYTIPGCGFCSRAKRLLEAKSAHYREIDVGGDPIARNAVRRRTGHPTFPQVFIGSDFVGGFEELNGLAEQGRLDGLLA